MMMDFSSLYDPLFCEEDEFEVEEITEQLPSTEAEDQQWEEGDEEWAEAVSSLLANEAETYFELSAAAGDIYLRASRNSAVEWVVKTSGQHGFSVQTVLLAVNYLDRCFLAGGGCGLSLQEDKPWMGRLAAVACLSLAAKVEETRAPLLLDLQLPPPAKEIGCVFENRTIRRMELLVLSTLRWRMNPVTPLSLSRRLLRKIPAITGSWQDLIARCEASFLAVVADWRWILYPPSVWAVAALHAVRPPADIAGSSPEMHLTLDILNISKDKVEAACRLIQELSVASNGFGGKRKHIYYSQCGSLSSHFSCGSPNGPVGTCFTCESSSNSTNSSAKMPSFSSSSSSFPGQPPFKKPNVKQIRDNGEAGNDQLAIDHGVLA
ncbi:Cyclin-D3-1 [Platanthera guangdongensis]|uniref:Cyclin-D3-1 n=1 Tax=Platanthera guangdongensis TaxID=2320717 RepID=A0ABR2LEC4_9ASPA